MTNIPKCCIDATSIEGMRQLYTDHPEDAHEHLRRHLDQVLPTQRITIHQACTSGYFPNTLPTAPRNPKRLIQNRNKLQKMIGYFSEDMKIDDIQEMDLWLLYIHVENDFSQMGFRAGFIHKPESQMNILVRQHFDMATLKNFRSMVHSLQFQMSNMVTPVLPTFQMNWRKSEDMPSGYWEHPNHPLNQFLFHHQVPEFGKYMVGLFDGEFKIEELQHRRAALAEYNRKKNPKEPKMLYLNPLGLRLCPIGWVPHRR